MLAYLQSIHYKLSQRTSDHPQYKILFGESLSSTTMILIVSYRLIASILATTMTPTKAQACLEGKRAGATDYLSWYWPKSPTQMLWQVLLILFHFCQSLQLFFHMCCKSKLDWKLTSQKEMNSDFKPLLVQFYNRWNTDYYDFNQSLTSSIHTLFYSHYFLLIFF